MLIDLPKLIEARKYGRLRFAVAAHWPQYPMNDLLASFGLKPNSDELREVDEAKAIQVVTAILWKTLTYNTELMPKAEAIDYAQKIVRGLTMYRKWALIVRSMPAPEVLSGKGLGSIDMAKMTEIACHGFVPLESTA